MIYASDLDQTLIYSARSIGVPTDSYGIVPAERHQEKTIAHISQEALRLLAYLPSDVQFVPVTTRTESQYRRIHIFQEVIVPQFAVTSNGGNIMKNGVPDREWRVNIERRLAAGAASAAEARTHFAGVLASDWVLREDLCDELFYSILIDRERMELEAVMEKAEAVKSLGWEVSIQGRKIYIVPSVINKWDAIAHIKSRLGGLEVIASGDSLLDRCLLDQADYAIAPAHGELFREKQRDPASVRTRFTERSGIFAADEIVSYVHHISQQLKAVNNPA
ncbi:HAD family hydrolase [Paenibacillus harenae]|uniref:HAD family hydrolase n=1 Tax=Paenibacillus harenae TaxID=306543 RepID=UPI0027935D9A|nr:HAD family hydrolase [Paenibacillus harenae]MDQ0061786.1 hydroxymethylpyrimidine pyrophosphatase-like HAD family hydrolase [Paenibacillus harenae]